jgi:hypothetical protein
MGYRDHFLNHAGCIAAQNEATLHAFDRTIPPRPIAMLLIGIGNGGVVEIWRNTLTEGSTVTALDSNPDAVAVPGLGVIGCDTTNRDEVRETLKGQWYDAVIDSTGTMQPYAWPFLRPGGVLIYESYNPEMIMMLARDLALGDDSWLPIEEVMRIDIYQSCAVIEKRNPRVVPYLNVLTGNFAEVVPESELIAAGCKRVIPA